jgi:hypothetical protein
MAVCIKHNAVATSHNTIIQVRHAQVCRKEELLVSVCQCFADICEIEHNMSTALEEVGQLISQTTHPNERT